MSRGLTNKKAAIIISNYNGLTDTKKCLDSLVKSSFKDFFVVVVDDYSGDKDVICILLNSMTHWILFPL